MRLDAAAIKALIAQRIEDARNRLIYSKASDIARYLGKQVPKRHGSNWVFCNGYLSIWFDDYGPNLSVLWRKQTVFSVHLGDITAYRPDVDDGEWIKRIDCLYRTGVVPVLEKQRRAEEERRARELYAKWGIKIGGF